MSKILAHRGASAYCPENTMAAFKKAIMLSADGLELDVHLTKDNELVVIHDFSLDRTTNGHGYIRNTSYSDIKNLDAGSWFNSNYSKLKIPLLKEVFSLINDKHFTINVELKAGNRYYPNIEEILLEEISKTKCNIIISSFDHYALKNIKEKNSNIVTGILYEASIINVWDYAVNTVRADGLHPNYMTIDYELITNCKNLGLMVNPYTVNDSETMKQLLSLNVDYIITNVPDLGKKLLN